MNNTSSTIAKGVQVERESYFGSKYHALERFISYHTQLELINAVAPESLLFIGVGDGVVPHLLAETVTTLKTLDFDPELKPDIIADVRKLPLEDKSVDAACAFEVLEHLPFEESRKAFAELARVTRTRVIISVPHRRTGFELVFKFPYARTILRGREFLRLALLFPIRFHGFASSGQHYWEIDGRTTTLRQVREAFREHFDILEERTAVLDPYRRYFVLQPRAV